MQNREPGSRPESPGEDSQDEWSSPGQRRSERPTMDKRGMMMFSEMEILGPEKDDVNRASAQNSFGIQAAIGGIPDEPVYELKIPLQSEKGKPYAVEALPGSEISVGLISGKVASMRRGGGPGGGMGGPGGRGGGMGPGGGSGGMGPGGGRGGMDGPDGGGAPPKMEGDNSSGSAQVKLWLRVQLAQ